MVTMPEITGRPVHGRDEESRPNNLTYTVTANNASISDDIAIRSWMIFLTRPIEYRADWAEKLIEYVDTHRLQIFADMVDILENHKPFSEDASTRFPEVETRLLQACCSDSDEYNDVMKVLIKRSQSANAEEEWGKAVEDAIRHELAEAKIHPDEYSVFIRSGALTEWVSSVISAKGNHAVQQVRSLASQGHIKRMDPKINIWPASGAHRRRGIAWLNTNGDAPEYAVDRRGRNIVILDKDNRPVNEELFV